MPEDVTHLLGGEGEPQPQEGEQQESQGSAEAQPAEEYIPFKYRGEERQIPASYLDGLAETAGVQRDTVLQWLTTGKDVANVIGETRQRERELAQREAELNAYYQQLEAQRAQAQPRPQQQAVDPEDPISLIRAIHDRQMAFEKAFQEERETFQRLLDQEREERNRAAFNEAYNSWADHKKGQGFKNVPTREELLMEAAEMGMGYMFNAGRLTPQQVYEKAFRSLRFEDAAAHGQQEYQQKLRDPRAKVVVPGGAGPAPQPKQPQEGSLESLGGIKWGEMIQNLPETRR